MQFPRRASRANRSRALLVALVSAQVTPSLLVALGAGLVEEAVEAPVEAPAEMPETGGARIMPAWIAVILPGVAAVATGTALRRFK